MPTPSQQAAIHFPPPMRSLSRQIPYSANAVRVFRAFFRRTLYCFKPQRSPASILTPPPFRKSSCCQDPLFAFKSFSSRYLPVKQAVNISDPQAVLWLQSGFPRLGTQGVRLSFAKFGGQSFGLRQVSSFLVSTVSAGMQHGREAIINVLRMLPSLLSWGDHSLRLSRTIESSVLLLFYCQRFRDRVQFNLTPRSRTFWVS